MERCEDTTWGNTAVGRGDAVMGWVVAGVERGEADMAATRTRDKGEVAEDSAAWWDAARRRPVKLRWSGPEPGMGKWSRIEFTC